MSLVLRNYRLARANLKAHRVRTVLTVIGVMIGVFVITLVMLVGSGLRKSIIHQVTRLDDQLVLIRSGDNDTSGLESFSPYNIPRITNLHERDIASVKNTPNVLAVTPMMFIGGRIVGTENEFDNITIVATNQNLVDVLKLQMASGEFLSDSDDQRNLVVLGSKLARGLLGTDQAYGQKIDIKGQEYTVIGVIREMNQPISLAGVDVDKAAFISLAGGRGMGGNNIALGQIIARAHNSSASDAAARIRSSLARVHVDESEFSVLTAREAAQATAGWVDTVTTAALIFASISLLVGGISIMNIMLVSVTERTREVGIRKAVGATRSKILVQFLFEALIMTLIGGAIGIALAYGTAYLVNLQFSLPMIFDWWVFAISLGVPLVVGLVFGIWPAARAARQDPIVALRQYH